MRKFRNSDAGAGLHRHMKKLVVLSLAAFSLGSIYAADLQPPVAPPADAPKPLPPLDQMAGPGRGKHKLDRPDWKNGPGQEKGRGWPKQGWRQERGPGGPGGPHGDGGPRGQGPGQAGHGEMLARQLNLTPDQKEKAKAIMEAAKPKIEAVRKESREKIQAVMADSISELRPILTPEQAAVLDDLQKLRADKAALDATQKPVDGPAKQKKPKTPKGE